MIYCPRMISKKIKSNQITRFVHRVFKSNISRVIVNA